MNMELTLALSWIGAAGLVVFGWAYLLSGWAL